MLIGRTDVDTETPNTLTTWCEELTHLKRPWCWERLRAGEEGDDRGWDGWMASPTQWTWVWVNSGSWWWTGRPGMLRSMGSQRVRHDWATELNWIAKKEISYLLKALSINKLYSRLIWCSGVTAICSYHYEHQTHFGDTLHSEDIYFSC